MSATHQMLLFGSAGLSLPYTITFNGYGTYAAMVAAYAALDIDITSTVPAQLGGHGVSAGMYYGTAYGEDTGPSNIPYDSFVPAVKSAYMFGNFFSGSFPQSTTIAIPAGTVAKQVTYDIWKNTAADLTVKIHYSNSPTEIVGTPTTFFDSPFDRTTALPVSPPTGDSYITSIEIESPVAGCRWAIDNITFSA